MFENVHFPPKSRTHPTFSNGRLSLSGSFSLLIPEIKSYMLKLSLVILFYVILRVLFSLDYYEQEIHHISNWCIY